LVRTVPKPITKDVHQVKLVRCGELVVDYALVNLLCEIAG